MKTTIEARKRMEAVARKMTSRQQEQALAILLGKENPTREENLTYGVILRTMRIQHGDLHCKRVLDRIRNK